MTLFDIIATRRKRKQSIRLPKKERFEDPVKAHRRKTS